MAMKKNNEKVGFSINKETKNNLIDYSQHSPFNQSIIVEKLLEYFLAADDKTKLDILSGKWDRLK